MKSLQKLETLTELELEAFTKLEKAIAENEEAAIAYVSSLREIRDRRLYRAEFSTFQEYCETRWSKSYRAVNMALQADQVRKDLKWEAASHLSDKAAITLGRVPAEIQKSVLKEATKSPTGPTAASIKRAAKKLLPAPEPEQPRAFGAFTDKPVDTSAYTSPRAEAPTPAEAFGGDEPEADAELPEVVDAASAARRLELVYERDKAWFNEVDGKGMPLRYPRAILDRLIGGLHE